MNIASKTLLLVINILWLLPSNAFSQNQVTIKDPDITFSYSLPENFVNQDDDYYHYIYPKNANNYTEAAIQLTYYQGYSGELIDFKDGVLNGKLANTLEDFELQDSGSDIIDGTVALWSKYAFTEKGVNNCGELICFVRIGQYFEIQIESPCADYPKYDADFKKILESIKVVKNL